jgi:putative endonuclease
MANRPASHYPDIGVLGEDLVSQWLQSTGWIILHHRWRCRWGEIDLIAQLTPHQETAGVHGCPAAGENLPLATKSSPLLAFVEVKTRSQGNWDAGGLLAITSKKQAKLWQTAQCFLTTFPDLADYPCRFDVALVQYRKLSKHQPSQSPKTSAPIDNLKNLPSAPIAIGKPIIIAGYQLVLQEYLASAFD